MAAHAPHVGKDEHSVVLLGAHDATEALRGLADCIERQKFVLVFVKLLLQERQARAEYATLDISDGCVPGGEEGKGREGGKAGAVSAGGMRVRAECTREAGEREDPGDFHECTVTHWYGMPIKTTQRP